MLFRAIPSFNQDELALPIEARVLDESGLGYIRINTFSDDYRMMAALWNHYIQDLIDNEVPGLIIDVPREQRRLERHGLRLRRLLLRPRNHPLSWVVLQRTAASFQASDFPARVQPGPRLYEGRSPC